MPSIPCSPRNRCKRWKECPHCAAIRQAQIANIAQLGASTSRSVTYAVVRPATNDIATQKNQILKALKSRVDGGIWTIETGKETAGLHANIIIGSDQPIHAADIATAITTEAEIYAEHIPHTDVRNVAAYSSKPAAFPSADEYTGRLYGSFGTWKRPLAAAAEGKINPEIAGLAIEQMLADAGIPEPPQKERPNLSYPPMSRDKESRDEIRKRIKHNKEEQERVEREHAEKMREHAREKYMKRLIAAHAGEIELNGYVYITGYGIATEKELKNLDCAKIMTVKSEHNCSKDEDFI